MTTGRRRYRRDVGRFDAWSDRYDQSALQRLFFERVQGQVVALAGQAVPDPGTILDVGCGTGRLLDRMGLAYPAARLVGVDPAPGMARVAARRHRVSAVVGTAEDLPVRAGSIDLLLTTVSFHHWRDQRRGLAELGRLLAAETGYLLLADVTLTGWARPFATLARVRDRVHTGPELDAMLREAGLRPRGRVPVPDLGGLVTITVATRA
jgi:ubiquinone/menaquinone biosynthesis C-methylase UbiE